MRFSLGVPILSLFFCAPVFPQNSGSIQCDPSSTRPIPAWTAPQSLWVVEYLNCGQMVTIVGLEEGYVKIQIGERIAYVEARYVKSTESQEPKVIEPVYQSKEYQQQVPQEQPKELQQPAPPAVAAEKATQPSVRGKLRRHEGSLGFEVSHIEYKEPSFSMKEDGIRWGVSSDYTFRPKKFMFRLDGRFSIGEVNYSSPSGVFDGIRDYNFETRFSLGYDLVGSQKSSFTPFMGLGYRFLFDGLSSAGPGGYDRKSNYLYSPIGAEWMIPLGHSWSLGMAGEYDLFWHGWQYSELGTTVEDPYIPIVLPDSTAKNDQEGGWGARASIKLVKNLGRVDFAIEPFFRYWDIGDSDVFRLAFYSYQFDTWILNTKMEPANRTTEWGVRLGIRF